MTNYRNHYSTRKTVTPQSQPIPKKNQVKNSAGGYSFAVSNWDRLQRFLILGSSGGTYYVNERKLTVENAQAVEACIKEDGQRVVNTIVEVSDAGRAPSNDPALFALAMCAAADDADTRKAALNALPQVARIGTHLFNFAEYVEGFRGWGRALRRAVANWYQGKTVDQIAFQAVKYQQRNGWSHRDLLRLAHPKTQDVNRNAVYSWIVGKEYDRENIASVIEGYEAAKSLEKDDESMIVNLIQTYNLPREAVPTHFLNSVKVWDALLEKMPVGAMVRNLGKMTSIGLIAPGSDAAKTVVSLLNDTRAISKSRIHPMAVLTALKVYENGGGYRGKLNWNPVQRVTDALDGAFYQAFGNVEPTDKRLVLALDVSGSMGTYINGSEVLSCKEAAAAMALVTANVESDYEMVAFSDKMVPINVSAKDRLDTVVDKMNRISFGGTDCALPMLWALGYNNTGGRGFYGRGKYNKISNNVVKTDAFVIYTDNETWFGSTHPCEALNQYRDTTGIPAKLAVVAMASNGFTIADPDDAGTLDIVGFDTATPNVLSGFIKG